MKLRIPLFFAGRPGEARSSSTMNRKTCGVLLTFVEIDRKV